MTTTTNKDSIQAINNSICDILKSVEGLDEKVFRWNPTEEEWSIMQIVSHLNEAIPYWLGEVERVVAEPGSKWGRGLEDESRLAAVFNPDELSIEEEIATLKKIQQQVSDRLIGLSEAQLNAENPHRNFEKFGHKPVSFIINHFLVEHVNGHYVQIQRNLSKRN
ncbi:DinB family protein [Bacillus sp. RS11]|uniref:DinB family protein n=1 Tax=Lysinibacillus sp. RS11 TaxID=3242682 RepID=UPI0035C7749A